jgi:Uma2 family endonuclease
MTEHLPLNTEPLPVKLRIEDYLLLDRSGAFDAYAKTELIEGEIYFMNAQHRPHALAKMELYDALRDRLREMKSSLRPIVEASIAIPERSAPEPDIVLTSEPLGEGLIPLASVALIVEVSDTTLASDLGRKAMLYARHGIPEYWVADLESGLMHQMWSPQAETYRERRKVRFGEVIEAVTIDGLAVETSPFELAP